MKIHSQKDFFAGLMFTGVGLAFALGATQYTLGSTEQMGAGYFPFVLGWVLAVLGALIVLTALLRPTQDGDRIGAFAWKPLCHVLGANLAFGALLMGYAPLAIPPMGMVVAIFALVFIASAARVGFCWKETLALAAVLSAGSYVVFVWALHVPMAVWPAFMTS
jgi:Tripartite tricarboxylate transporter TctB family